MLRAGVLLRARTRLCLQPREQGSVSGSRVRVTTRPRPLVELRSVRCRRIRDLHQLALTLAVLRFYCLSSVLMKDHYESSVCKNVFMSLETLSWKSCPLPCQSSLVKELYSAEFDFILNPRSVSFQTCDEYRQLALSRFCPVVVGSVSAMLCLHFSG